MSHKKIIAFLQLYNESEKGNLVRCLENCKQWSDEIVIYDDASTDDSLNIYLNYTDRNNIIIGTENEFNKELYHKQKLLELALSKDPDYIGWIDGDDIFDKALTEDMQGFLNYLPSNIDAVWLHNVNLWRDECFYRVDSEFNSNEKANIWRNNGNLKYEPSIGLHKPQTPIGLENYIKYGHNLIHYGFSSERSIVRKYLDYKKQGQNGWMLDRLIDESSMRLFKLPKEVYPTKNIPLHYDTVEEPIRLTYDQYRVYNSWEEYVNSSSFNL